MEAKRGEIEIRTERRESVVVLRVEGEVIRDNQVRLRAALEDLIRDGVRGIALDLSNVVYMDSAGLGCCASIQKLLRVKGRALVAFGAVESVDSTWKLIRLDLVVPLLASEEEALGWLERECRPAP